jgi:hypothetical protein
VFACRRPSTATGENGRAGAGGNGGEGFRPSHPLESGGTKNVGLQELRIGMSMEYKKYLIVEMAKFLCMVEIAFHLGQR